MKNTAPYDDTPLNFYLYRFQLTVTTPTPFQTQTIYKNGQPVNIDTPGKLMENKLFILREILKEMDNVIEEKFHIRKEDYTEKDGDQFLLTCKKNTNISYTENYQKKKQLHQPFVWIAIDTSEHVQTIGITGCKDLGANTAAKKFSAILQNSLKKYNITLEINPIRPQFTFWDFIKEHKSIKTVSFTLPPPNMSDLNDTFTEELREYTGSTGGGRTQVTTTANGSNALDLSQNNPRLEQMARCADLGGGSYYIVPQGSTKRISPKGKGVHEFISASPLPLQQEEFQLQDKKKGILTKLREICTLRKKGNQ